MRKNAKLPRVVASRVRKARRSAGMSQEDLADKVGVSRVYIGYVEQGRNVPTLEVLSKIAKVLKVRLSEIVE